MAILPVDAVEYLIFSGGGSKAFVHFGAARAILERLGLDSGFTGFEPRNENTAHAIRGMAGSSAGALIGLLLAMGQNAMVSEYWLKRTLVKVKPPTDEGPAKSKHDIPRILADYAIGPKGMRSKAQDGFIRLAAWPRVRRNGSPQFVYRLDRNQQGIYDKFLKDLNIAETLRDSRYAKEFFKLQALKEVINGLGGGISFSTDSLALGLESLIRSRVKGTEFAFLAERIPFRAYVFNLLAHGGMLPGMMLRQSLLYLASKTPLAEDKGWTIKNLRRLTFQTLYDATGYDLVVTGTNLTSKRIGYFSVTLTPNFPVIEAVAISMHYPFLFKPVVIAGGGAVPPGYAGRWVDGGLINNFPLHAFDRAPHAPTDHRAVGFFLKEKKYRPVAIGLHEMAQRRVAEVFDAVMDQSTRGQIRSSLEELQTVELDASGLSTLDIIPNWRTVDKLIQRAMRRTNRYFSKARKCASLLQSWAKKDPRPPIPSETFEAIARAQMRGAFPKVSRRQMRVQSNKPNRPQYADFDIIVETELGEYLVYEAKSTKNARLTSRQALAIPEIAKYGGTISASKDDDPPFTDNKAPKISRHAVRILRPQTLCKEFELARKHQREPSKLPAQSEAERGKGYPKL